jgi:formylglycine-generating enzyme required for sulfatase activity
MSVDLGNGVKMDFVLIHPGKFRMGFDNGDAGERPVHKVTITKPFYMGIYEVTQAQWKAIMGENPATFKGDDLPVENVSWEHCQKFVARLKEKAGQGMTCRLPTEAEWEYACRAGSRATYCFGDDDLGLGEYAWYTRNSEKKTHPVGQKKPNAWGLYDMHGNVWEWCADWYDARYYGKSPGKDPQGPASGDYRVLRGASWYDSPDIVRSAFRYWDYPSYASKYAGCRLVVSAYP